MSKREFIDAAEEVAFEGLKAMKAYLAYQGENPMYEKKAKIGGQAVQGFTRHYASLTNREALKFAQQRQVGEVKALHNGHAVAQPEV